jgi:hypothetical protein
LYLDRYLDSLKLLKGLFMILPVLKYCLPIYLLLAGGLFLEIRGGRTLGAALVLLGLIVAITVLGLILGMILSVLVRKPKFETVFYLIGQVVAFGLIVTPFLSVVFGC